MSIYSPTELAAAFPNKQVGTTLFAFEEMSSTNSFGLELIHQTPQDGILICTNGQSRGRGRLERRWFSPPCLNIYASLVKQLQPTFPIQNTGWIPLLAGVSIAKTLKEITDLPLSLKWPNDILIQKKKVGGILCESANDRNGTRWVVIGFGINVNLNTATLPVELQETATSLRQESGHDWDRLTLLRKITMALEEEFAELANSHTGILNQANENYQRYSSTIGHIIQVQFPDGSNLTGFAQAIGEQGQLQVRPISSQVTTQFDKIVDVHSADILHIRPVGLL